MFYEWMNQDVSWISIFLFITPIHIRLHIYSSLFFLFIISEYKHIQIYISISKVYFNCFYINCLPIKFFIAPNIRLSTRGWQGPRLPSVESCTDSHRPARRLGGNASKFVGPGRSPNQTKPAPVSSLQIFRVCIAILSCSDREQNPWCLLVSGWSLCDVSSDGST